METRLALLLALTLLIRGDFWNQAILGDDEAYLNEATHALIDPLHPLAGKVVFLGQEYELRGHPHGPMMAWVLAGLIAICGSVKEIPFHAAFTVFSLIAVAAMWSLARRFSAQPGWATLLFIAAPVFLVNGNSLETDVPFVSFWLASIALFERHRWAACGFMVLAALTSPQSTFLTPILLVYAWLFFRRDRSAWIAAFVPAGAYVAWQFSEFLSSGALPAQVLASNLAQFDRWNPWARVALVLHSWFLIFPLLVPGAFLLAWRKRHDPRVHFLLAWIGLFFAGALVVFIFGSARYLLPMAPPFAILASQLRPKWLAAGFAAQLTLALGLAIVNYQHWDAYRRLARDIRPITAGHRVWADAEWGLRHYLKDEGGLTLTRNQQIRTGDFIVSSELGAAVHPTAPMALVKTVVIDPTIPLRIIGLESHSGYSTVGSGIWPFGITGGVIDRVHVSEVVERKPTLTFLPMNAPEAETQIVSGIYPLEESRYRWMSGHAVIALKPPQAARPLRVEFGIPPNAPARQLTLLLDGKQIAVKQYSGPGEYILESDPAAPGSSLEIVLDRTFTAPPDTRELGIVLTAAGFAPSDK